MVTGAVGVAAYEALRKMVVKAPLRAATVSVATGFNVDAVRAVAIEETVSIFFDALASLDQDPQFGAPAGADHDGRGGSQAQRTRARDDQHRDRGGHTSHRVGGDQCPLRRQRGHPPSSRPGRIRR